LFKDDEDTKVTIVRDSDKEALSILRITTMIVPKLFRLEYQNVPGS